ncbi:MAG TPA: MBL fold metallo-hydrolase [Ktedonobacteraceae bacterium]|nr:MBL fold metallo-hydrolase [Ktedonobacteraceae bacterium]
MSTENDDLPQSRHFHLMGLAEGVYAAMSVDGSGSFCNAGIIDLGDRTLVFDTFLTPEAGEDLRRAAEHLTGRPVSYIVNSHYNADHIYGNQVFTEATIISTEKTRDLIATRGVEVQEWMKANLAEELRAGEEQLQHEQDETRRKQMELDLTTDRLLLSALPGLELRLPELTFEHKLVLYGTKRRAEVLSLGGGHTPSDAFLYLPDEHIAFLGDLLFTKKHPSMWHDQPQEWVSILGQIEQLDPTTVVPGHGPLGTREDVILLRQYFMTLLEMASAVIARGGSADDAAQEPIPAPYAHWQNTEAFGELMRSFVALQQKD